MSFFDLLFRKQNHSKSHRITHFSENYHEVLLQYHNIQIIYSIQQQSVQYKNILSPSDWGPPPKEFINSGTTVLSPKEIEQLSSILKKNLASLSFSDAPIILPPGASYDGLLILTTSTGENRYYSNCHQENFSIKTEPLDPSFLDLYHCLIDICRFSALSDCSTLEPMNDNRPLQDPRHFQETLWICQNCSTGNLLEHSHCIRCGAARPW